MSTLHEAAAACCAHLRVHWAETKHPDGTISGRWLCTLCGAEFRNSPGIEPLTPMAEALAEAQRQADTTTAQLERSVEELGASVDRVIAENEALQDELARARADRDTAANVDRQLRARVDELEAARTDALLFSHESMWRDVLDWMEADLANLGPGPAGGREGRVKHVRQALERAALRDAAFEQAKAENAALLNAFPEYGKTGNELREERARTEAVRAVLRRNGFRECDIPACNCGSWHAPPNLRAEKAEEERDGARERWETAEKDEHGDGCQCFVCALRDEVDRLNQRIGGLT